MKATIGFAALMIVTSVQANAFEDGTYKCKNSTGLPENVIKIQSIALVDDGPSLPIVESTRHYRSNSSDPNSEIKTSKLIGLATVSQIGDSSMLMVGALRLEFIKNKLGGCEKQ